MDSSRDLEQLACALDSLDSKPPEWGFDEKRAENLLAIGYCLERLVREGRLSDLHKFFPNPVWDLVEPRLDAALTDVVDRQVDPGEVVLWQGYSSSVVARDEGCTAGFDVLPLPRFYGWPDRAGLTERYAEALDMLFVTHRHADHYDRELVAACLDRGKRVFLPASLAGEWAGSAGCFSVEDGLSLEGDGVAVSAKEGIHVWRDRPDEVPLVYYDVRLPGGCRLVYGGDVDYTKAFDVEPGPDLLFVTWRAPNARYEPGDPDQAGDLTDATRLALDRADPRMLMFEHYAELDHVYDGFPASYDLALGVQEGLERPSAILFWGERLSLRPRSRPGSRSRSRRG